MTWEAEKEGGCRRAEQGEESVKVRVRHYLLPFCANIHGASSSAHSQGTTGPLDQSPHVQSHPKNKLLPSAEFKEGPHQAALNLKSDTSQRSFLVEHKDKPAGEFKYKLMALESTFQEHQLVGNKS